ncbi:DUF1156 domain-containing protein [Thermoflexus sp.]|uniref:DUF1156 domain-containing protein n=1 Tax=Thermoflexus sp. TaxID=1969742 RepID=UPI002ADE59FB|nr:DUF1156 domain-containing protein [Thermoflexus sp.]
MARALIEVAFPFREVSEESVCEKYIHQGHISTLHTWWARQPLAASRAIALAALLPDDPARRAEWLELVRQIAPWKVVSDGTPESRQLLERAQEAIREAFGGRPPRVLDPFAGGGSIPLEALRLGCETYALDYNPVAMLLNKAVLEFPQRFGPALVEAVRRWGNWVLEGARRELAPFYPSDPDGAVPMGYIWARTLPCQNPSCGAEIPLMYRTWLAKSDKRMIALRLIPHRAANRIEAEIVGQGGEPINFNPDEGTASWGRVRCPLCGGTIDAKTTRRLFREGRAGQRMMAVMLRHPKRAGKSYRLPTERDLAAYRAAEAALEEKRQALWAEWGMDPVPDEPLPPQGTLGLNVQRYGLTRWGDLFNARQKLALITFADAVRRAYVEMLQNGYMQEFARAATTYLAIIFNRLAEKNANMVTYHAIGESAGSVFSEKSISMAWDYIEINPFADIGWSKMQERVELSLNHLTGGLLADGEKQRKAGKRSYRSKQRTK